MTLTSGAQAAWMTRVTWSSVFHGGTQHKITNHAATHSQGGACGHTSAHQFHTSRRSGSQVGPLPSDSGGGHRSSLSKQDPDAPGHND